MAYWQYEAAAKDQQLAFIKHDLLGGCSPSHFLTSDEDRPAETQPLLQHLSSDQHEPVSSESEEGQHHEVSVLPITVSAPHPLPRSGSRVHKWVQNVLVHFNIPTLHNFHDVRAMLLSYLLHTRIASETPHPEPLADHTSTTCIPSQTIIKRFNDAIGIHAGDNHSKTYAKLVKQIPFYLPGYDFCKWDDYQLWAISALATHISSTVQVKHCPTVMPRMPPYTAVTHTDHQHWIYHMLVTHGMSRHLKRALSLQTLCLLHFLLTGRRIDNVNKLKSTCEYQTRIFLKLGPDIPPHAGKQTFTITAMAKIALKYHLCPTDELLTYAQLIESSSRPCSTPHRFECSLKESQYSSREHNADCDTFAENLTIPPVPECKGLISSSAQGSTTGVDISTQVPCDQTAPSEHLRPVYLLDNPHSVLTADSRSAAQHNTTTPHFMPTICALAITICLHLLTCITGMYNSLQQ